MKRFIIILLFFPLISTAQKTDSIPFKGATKIIVKNELSAEANYKLIISKLLDDGFVISAKDNEYFTVKTEEKDIKKSTYKYLLDIRAKDKEILFSGKYRTGVEITVGGTSSNTNKLEQIEYKNWAGNKLTFKNMENAAKLLSMPLVYSN